MNARWQQVTDSSKLTIIQWNKGAARSDIHLSIICYAGSLVNVISCNHLGPRGDKLTSLNLDFIWRCSYWKRTFVRVANGSRAWFTAAFTVSTVCKLLYKDPIQSQLHPLSLIWTLLSTWWHWVRERVQNLTKATQLGLDCKIQTQACSSSKPGTTHYLIVRFRMSVCLLGNSSVSADVFVIPISEYVLCS